MALKLKQRTIETQKIHYQRKKKRKSFLPGSAVDLGSVWHMRKKINQNGVLEWGSVNKKPTFLYCFVQDMSAGYRELHNTKD